MGYKINAKLSKEDLENIIGSRLQDVNYEIETSGNDVVRLDFYRDLTASEVSAIQAKIGKPIVKE